MAMLKGGPFSVHCKQWHLSGFVNSYLKEKKRKCNIFNWFLHLGFLYGRWENTELPHVKLHESPRCPPSIEESLSKQVPRRCLQEGENPLCDRLQKVFGVAIIFFSYRTSIGQWKKNERQEVSEWSANHEAGSEIHCEGFADYNMVWTWLLEKSAEKTISHKKRWRLVLKMCKSHHLKHLFLLLQQNLLLNSETVQKVGFLSCHKISRYEIFITKQE